MRGKTLPLLALIVLANLACIGVIGIQPASATPGPTVFMNSTGTGTTPTQIFPRVAYNSYFYVYVKITGTPHLTNETGTGPGGTNPTDLAWAYQVSIKWNASVLNLTSTWVLEPGRWTPGTPGVAYRSFLKFAYWWTDGVDWYTDAGYATSFASSVDTPGGTALIGMTLLAQNPDKQWNYVPIPPEMKHGDPSHVEGCPDEGYHEGTYYDLPYNVTNKYDMLVRLRFKDNDPTGNPNRWSIIDIVPGTADTKLKTVSLGDVIPECIDSYYGAMPTPEFPFGIGFVMILAPAIPIIYLWRTRKKVIKK